MHRGSHIGMPQQFTYCFHVKSMGNAVGCKDMTEHMKVKGGQAKCVQDFPESVLQGPRFGIFFFLSRKKVAVFVSFLFLQKTQKIVREGNLPVRIQGFWRCDCYFRSCPGMLLLFWVIIPEGSYSLQRFPDMHSSLVKADILPPQGTKLSNPDSAAAGQQNTHTGYIPIHSFRLQVFLQLPDIRIRRCLYRSVLRHGRGMRVFQPAALVFFFNDLQDLVNNNTDLVEIVCRQSFSFVSLPQRFKIFLS